MIKASETTSWQLNRLFGRLSQDYGGAVTVAARRRHPILLIFVVLLGCTWLMFRIVNTVGKATATQASGADAKG